MFGSSDILEPAMRYKRKKVKDKRKNIVTFVIIFDSIILSYF